MPDLLSWLRAAPPGTSVPAATLAEMLDVGNTEPANTTTPTDPAAPATWTWRERLWTVPAETRLTTREALEALGRSRSWMYGHLAEERGAARLPHRKLDGELVFTAGELRAWIRHQEEVQHAGPMETTATERHLRAVKS